MTRTQATFRALLESLGGLGLAKKPTTQQVQSVCSAFVEMVAEVEQQRVTLIVGQTVIAREHEQHKAALTR